MFRESEGRIQAGSSGAIEQIVVTIVVEIGPYRTVTSSIDIVDATRLCFLGKGSTVNIEEEEITSSGRIL